MYSSQKTFILFDELKSRKFKIFKNVYVFASTFDRKEEIQQYNDNVNLRPVDVSYKQLKQMNNNKDIDPSELENSDLKKDIVNVFCNIIKEVADTANHNLVRNWNAYMSKGGKIDPEFPFSWIDNSYQEAQEKFQLGY